MSHYRWIKKNRCTERQVKVDENLLRRITSGESGKITGYRIMKDGGVMSQYRWMKKKPCKQSVR